MSKITAIESLPNPFLELDERKLRESAQRNRTVADLRSGISNMNRAVDAGLFELTKFSADDAKRSPNRGGAIAWSLLDASIPNLSHNLAYGGSPESRIGIESGMNELMTDARLEVIHAWQFAQNHGSSDYEAPVDTALAKAGLRDNFSEALLNFDGGGIETIEFDAKCGAAVVALTVGAFLQPSN